MQSGDVGSKRRSLGWKVEIWVGKGSATNTEILGKEKKVVIWVEKKICSKNVKIWGGKCRDLGGFGVKASESGIKNGDLQSKKSEFGGESGD